MPSVRIGTTSFISPATATSFYASPPTPPANYHRITTTPDEITELARALRNDPDLIYDYVRDTIEITWMYGLQRGALGAMQDRSGTAFDQAKLMVDLLLAAGHSSARYVRGTITISGTQFQQWSNVTGATAACQLLSSGGIPAIIDTASIAGTTGETRADCNYGADAVTGIRLGHVWVRVNIAGTDYYFDPSFKPHTFNAGVANLATIAGLTAGQALTAAGGTTGTDSGTGVPFAQTLNATSLNTTVQGYANNLQTHIEGPLQSGDMEDLVGGRDIVRNEGTLRQESYGDPSGQLIWTSIPDVYRTTLRVNLDLTNATSPCVAGLFDLTLFVDEIYGRRLIVDTNFREPINWSQVPTFTATLKLLNAENVGATIATYTCADQAPILREGVLELTVNHAYAARAPGSAIDGTYMDRVSSRTVEMVVPLLILHGWGDVSSAIVEAYGTHQEPALPFLPQQGCEECGRAFTPNGESRREQLGASWLAQSSRAAQIHAEIADAIYTHHHSVGVVSADVHVNSFLPNPQQPPSPGNLWRYVIRDSFDRIDVDMGFSLTMKSGTTGAATRRAVIHAIAATTETLQGSVAAQVADLPDTSSTATRFEWANAPPDPEDFSSGNLPRRFYRFTSGNASAASSLVVFEDGTSPTGNGFHPAGEPIIGNTEKDAWRTRLITTIGNYASAGFEVVASEDAFLGPGQRAGAYSVDHLDVQGDPVFLHQPTPQRGGALVATRYDGAGEPLEIAHITVGFTLSAKGGGGGAQTDHQATYDPSTAADVLRARFVDRSNAVGVDLQTGAPTVTSPASLRVGNGDFPYELSANLIWRGGQLNDERFGPVIHTEPQTPWTTNWNNTLTVSGSGMEAMGQTDHRASASTIAAFLAMQDIYAGAVSNTRDAAALLVGSWWADRVTGNVATVNVGADTRQFLRNAGGNWFSPGAGAFSTLAQTGQRAVFVNTISTCGAANPNDPQYGYTRGWDYDGVSFVVTNTNGDQQTFSRWENFFAPGEGSTCNNQQGWRMTQWSFPQGVTITLTYANGGIGTHEELTRVENNLGRRIDFLESGRLGFINGLTGGDLRRVDVSRTGDVTTHTSNGNTAEETVDRFDHDAVNERHLLNEIFDANDTTTPSLRYIYDSLHRVKEAFDAEALQDPTVTRDQYIFRLAPNYHGERQDPLGEIYRVLYNEEGRAARFIDELLRVTSADYDGRGRATRYVYPELDEERLTYNTRNQVTEFRRCAKTGCNPSTDIVVQASWNTTWNKPATITDARGYRTDFAYGASGNSAGQLLTATRPAPSGAIPTGSGARPVYTFTYGSFGRVATTTDPTGVVTTNIIATSDGANAKRGDITSTTITNISATTAFTYDAQGDVLTSTDPRNNATSTSYDLRRRPTLVRNHNGNSLAALLAAQRTNYNVVGQVISTEGGLTFSGTNVLTWLTRESRTYTPTGQVATVTLDPGSPPHINATTTNTYDGLDRLLRVTDPVGRVTFNDYDDAGQLERIVRAEGTAIQQDYARYTYSDNGQRLSVRDARNNRSVYVYDGFDRLCRLYFPVQANDANAANLGTGGVEGSIACGDAPRSGEDYEGYGYDANGNRTTLRVRSSETIRYHYDNLNRECFKDLPSHATTPTGCGTSITGAGATDVFSDYDLVGRRLSSRFGSTSGQGIVYAYDTAGRLGSETSTIGTSRALSYQYDIASNRTRVTWPVDSFFAQYTYDAMNRVDQIGENGVFSGASLLADYNYDALARRATLARGNGTVTTYGYDTASRLTSLGQNLDGAATPNDQTLGFSYTNASQINQRTATNDLYSWITPAVNRSYARNGLNQYTSTTGTGAATFGYDPRGNLTGDGSRSFVYDLENRLTTVSGTASGSLSYDPLGRLRQVTASGATTDFLYDGDRLSAEYNNSGGALSRRYVHGPGVDEPIVWYEGAGTSDRRYLITDHQGSVIAENGASTARYSYGPYGEPHDWDGPNGEFLSRHRYTGQAALPELQLYHYKARVYDPVLGRFLQTDPVGYEDDVNLYIYVVNDPLNRSDPTGRQAQAAALLCAGPQALACAAGVVVGTIIVVGGGCAISEQCRGEVGEFVDGILNSDDQSDSDDDRDRATIGLAPDGKVHGDLPAAGDIAEDDLERTDQVLGESMDTRSRENEAYPPGNPNGTEEEQRDFERYQQHQERIEDEQRLQEGVRERMRGN